MKLSGANWRTIYLHGWERRDVDTFWGLAVRFDDSIGGVYAYGIHVVAFADFEDAILVLENPQASARRCELARDNPKPILTAAGATKSQPVLSNLLLQYTTEFGTAGSQILKQKALEPMKLHGKAVINGPDTCAFKGDYRTGRDLLMPLNDLLERVVIATIAWEGISVHQASERVTTLHKAYRA